MYTTKISSYSSRGNFVTTFITIFVTTFITTFCLRNPAQEFRRGRRGKEKGQGAEALPALSARDSTFIPPRLSLSLSQLFFICLLCLARSRSILGGYSAACDGEKGRIADERDTGHLLIRNAHKVTSFYRDNVLYRGELKGL